MGICDHGGKCGFASGSGSGWNRLQADDAVTTAQVVELECFCNVSGSRIGNGLIVYGIGDAGVQNDCSRRCQSKLRNLCIGNEKYAAAFFLLYNLRKFFYTADNLRSPNKEERAMRFLRLSERFGNKLILVYAFLCFLAI